MATSEILLLKKIDHLGYEGDTVTVRAGYARNYLLPRALAVPVTRANKRQIDALRVRRQEREVKELQEAKELAQKIHQLVISLPVKTGANGRMFGAVTASDLAKKFNEQGFSIDRRRIHLEPIKRVGQASAKIRLHTEVAIDFSFDIVSESGTM